MVSPNRRFPALSQSCIVAIVLALLVAPVSAADSIFDDNWSPPKPATPKAPPTPKPPVQPNPTPGAPNLPTATRPATAPVSPATPPAPIAPVVKKAIPSAADLARSRQLLKEVFAAQLADRSIAARGKLADILLQEAAKADASASDQYVLYGGAINAAKEGASLSLVFRAAEELAERYDVDAPAIKAAAAISMPLKHDSPAVTIDNVLAGLQLIDSLVAEENFAGATTLVNQLRPLSANDKDLVPVVQKRAAEVEAMRVARERVAPAMQQLVAAPANPAANLAVGSYYCFALGNWQKGLPMLARGADPELKRIALAELAHPQDVNAIIALGDDWWNIAARQPVTVQPRVRQHAAAIYSPSLDRTGHLQKLKIEKRIAEAANAPGAGPDLSAVAARRRVAQLKAFREQFDFKPGVTPQAMPVGDPLVGEVTWAPNRQGFSLDGVIWVGHNPVNHGKKEPERKAQLTVAAGFRMTGGKLLISQGSVSLMGEPSNPIVLKNVQIECELTGSLRAFHVIFDNCTFNKVGPFSWGVFSSKWRFEDCLLYQSNFKSLTRLDYGIKLRRCTFASCKFPDRRPGKKTDSAKEARDEWSSITDCEFYDSELAANVFWITERCNFIECKAAGSAAFESPNDLDVELGLIAADREKVLADLRGRTTTSGAGKPHYRAAAAMYPSHAFPKR
jgi:hypothetical protein